MTAADAAVRWLDPVPPGASQPEGEAERLVSALHRAEATVLLGGGSAAAVHALCALTNPGGHVIVSAGLCASLGAFLEDSFARLGRDVTYLDCADVAAVAAAIRPETQLIFAESVADPLMRLTPVNDLAELAHGSDLPVLVDNTGLSPAMARPLDMGATMVVENCVPYLSGPAVVDASVACGPRRLVRRIAAQARPAGAAPGAWSGGLLSQALHTLELRMAAHQRNADAIAEFLRGHPGVAAVYRPGFDAAPWAIETHRGFGGLLSFLPRRGLPREALSREALSGLVSLPALDFPGASGARHRERMGVPPELVRVTAGLEPPAGQIAALRGLLGAAAGDR
jgi:cystathionine beta-lyase/cystathionine gamma-synthase